MTTDRKQVNIRIDLPLYRVLESIARSERRTVPQAARLLLELGLRRHGGARSSGKLGGEQIAPLAQAGGSFAWLEEEPELYDDTCGEPV